MFYLIRTNLEILNDLFFWQKRFIHKSKVNNLIKPNQSLVIPYQQRLMNLPYILQAENYIDKVIRNSHIKNVFSLPVHDKM